MPGMGGFEVLHHLPKDDFRVVIMVTAYDQHAIRALKLGPEQAVERAGRLRGNPPIAADTLIRLREIARPRPAEVGKIGEEYFQLNAEEILVLDVSFFGVSVVGG